MTDMSYGELLSYQQAEEIYELNMRFCAEFLSGKQFARQREQMEQAGRSGKQNIVEGAEQHTDLKGYAYLLGIARGSLAELLEDYKDLAKLRGIEVWRKGDERIEKVKKMEKAERVNFLFPSSPSYPSKPSSSSSPSPTLINYLVDLIIRTNYLLDRQKKSLEEKFVNEGGYSEKLARQRNEVKKKEIVNRFWRKYQ